MSNSEAIAGAPPSLQMVRHATTVLQIEGVRLLSDPMLGARESIPPIPLTMRQVANPLVELPVPVDELLQVDAVLVSHNHVDHFDDAARSLLSKSTPLLCQPYDVAALESAGFEKVVPVNGETRVGSISITRVDGRHGRGFIQALMGPVSGFMVEHDSVGTVYMAGDSVVDEVFIDNIRRFDPAVVVVNGGAAYQTIGSSLTMTTDDVLRTCRLVAPGRVIAIHMDAFSHCRMSRSLLRTCVRECCDDSCNIVIPEDGELVDLASGECQQRCST